MDDLSDAGYSRDLVAYNYLNYSPGAPNDPVTVILITGASSGIGAAYSLDYCAEKGYRMASPLAGSNDWKPWQAELRKMGPRVSP